MNRNRVTFKVFVGLAVGVLCLAVALANVDTDEVLGTLSGFDLRYLAVAIGLSFLIEIIRAWRWKIELSPLAEVSFVATWQVIAVSYMMINLLPFRLGEPVRPLLMSRKSGIPVSAVVGNWVFEKTLDSAVVLLFVQITLVVADLPAWAHTASTYTLATFLILASGMISFWFYGERFYSATLGRLLSEQTRARVLSVLMTARRGLDILPDKRLVSAAFGLSLVLWSIPVLSSYVLILGFGFDLPFSAALVVFVCIGLGTALPNPPGMVGVFQIAAVVGLGFYGIDKSSAVAYGILLNALQLSTLVFQGLVALPFIGQPLTDITKAALEESRENSGPQQAAE